MPHIHEKIDYTVEVFIVCGDRILLRKHDKYGLWLGVGGHVELDEDPNQAAVREVKEESGLDIVLADYLRTHPKKTEDFHELISPTFMNRHRINDGHEHIGMIYFATSESMEAQNGTTEQSEAMQWLTAEEVKKLPDLTDHVRHYALTALSVLSKKR